MSDPENIKKLKQEMKTSQTIFTPSEIDETVKTFLLAYLHGKIHIQFPTSGEIKRNYQKSGTPLKPVEAFTFSLENKERFLYHLSICCGHTPSTVDELLQSKMELFRLIFLLKMNHRLKGSFLEFQEGEKIKEFEEKLNATNNLVTKLLQALTDEANEDSKMP